MSTKIKSISITNNDLNIQYEPNISPSGYNCVNNSCIESTSGTGTYTTMMNVKHHVIHYHQDIIV